MGDFYGDRECEGPWSTHHLACRCREQMFADQLAEVQKALGSAQWLLNNLHHAGTTAFEMFGCSVLGDVNRALAILGPKPEVAASDDGSLHPDASPVPPPVDKR